MGIQERPYTLGRKPRCGNRSRQQEEGLGTLAYW
ncbi:hypothetical protein LINPERPRIM_LOCUS39162 [Linum perenne]